MPDEPRRRHIARFALVTTGMSVLLGVPLLLVGSKATSAFVLDLVSVLGMSVPVWSIFAGAVGVSVARKVQFSVSLLAFVLVFDIVAYLTGWQALTTGTGGSVGIAAGALVVLYTIVLEAAPVVALVLFVGKQPSILWREEA